MAAIESRQTSCLGCDSFSSNRGCAGVVRLCPSCPGSLVATALMLRSHPSTDLQMMASRPSYMWQQTHLDIHIRLILSDLACHGWESGTQPHPRAFSKLFHCPDLPQTHSLTTFSPLPCFFFPCQPFFPCFHLPFLIVVYGCVPHVDRCCCVPVPRVTLICTKSPNIIGRSRQQQQQQR